MENTHLMLEKKLLEDNLAMPNQKLELQGIFEKARADSEIDSTLIVRRLITHNSFYKNEWELRTTFSHQLVQLGFLYLVPFHLLELCTVIVTVDLASKIYAEDRPILTLKEMLKKQIYGARIRALLLKYLEWSAVWNVSIVISVLEGTFGVRAMALSARFNRGSERRGLLLMAVFFVWGLGLRLPCLYFRCYEGEIMGIVAQVGLFCLGNVLKWVACMLYFYDCKKQTLEKKVDVEAGREIKVVDA
ncbi:hypothetical protein F2P56_035769 [Juglans regia]|uniref:Uncharacterized protein n=1 Tax=Juglans regia TaxID=51240 RepID=A0A833U2T8_JUGRE|nr:hypothetical protein F2P56_035769 [Juglans regia]